MLVTFAFWQLDVLKKTHHSALNAFKAISWQLEIPYVQQLYVYHPNSETHMVFVRFAKRVAQLVPPIPSAPHVLPRMYCNMDNLSAPRVFAMTGTTRTVVVFAKFAAVIARNVRAALCALNATLTLLH